MKPATFGLLAGLTVVVVGGAWYASRSGSDGAGASTLPTRLFPEFAKRVNDVASVEIEKGSEHVTLVKKDNLWTLANRGGYPVDFEKVKKAVMDVSNLEVLEAKTKNPAQYDKLDLQDPKEGAPSTRLTLKDAGGANLAALIVGKSNWGGKASVYVRKLDDAQSYLCQGELRLEAGPTTWIKKDVLKLDRERIRAVEVAHADGETLRIQKQLPEDVDFAVLDIPPTRELASAGVAGQLGSVLTWVSVDDVAPLAEVGFDGLSVTTATFRTFDGLVIELRLADKDGKSYAAMKASWEEPPARPAPSESQPASAASAKLKSADAVRQEIEELNRAHGAWVYVLPSFKATSITKRMNDMLAPLPDPAAPIDEGQPNALPPGHTADDGHDH
ncbi:MAG: DUF4340 domain-containing protein [Planctomycetes bacterium]|nr:DUF4340 domain-containing protein [Planctomycetota bacterium]